MVTISYVVRVVHLVEVVHHDVLVSPPMQLEELSAQDERFPPTTEQVLQPS